MKTIKIKLYEFSELSEKAKEAAKDDFYYDDFFANERMKSKKAAADIYESIDPEKTISGVRLYKYIQNNVMPELRKYKYYTKNSAYYAGKNHGITMGEKFRFSKINYSEGEVNLTGVCYDYDFLKPLIDFMKNPSDSIDSDDLRNINTDNIYEKLTEDEYYYFYRDEVFEEHCRANEYLFYENGKMYY